MKSNKMVEINISALIIFFSLFQGIIYQQSCLFIHFCNLILHIKLIYLWFKKLRLTLYLRLLLFFSFAKEALQTMQTLQNMIQKLILNQLQQQEYNHIPVKNSYLLEKIICSEKVTSVYQQIHFGFKTKMPQIASKP